MILEEATHEVFKYYPSKLKLQSHKLIIAACEICGDFRVLRRGDYSTFCQACSQIFGERAKGENNSMFGKCGENAQRWNGGQIKCVCFQCSKEFKVDQNVIKHGNGKFCCVRCARKAASKGGLKLAWRRNNAKRKQLGYTLLMPLAEGEVGHHVTNEYVIGIPKDIHKKLAGRRMKHRVRVLQWLKVNDIVKYNLVLAVLVKEPLE